MPLIQDISKQLDLTLLALYTLQKTTNEEFQRKESTFLAGQAELKQELSDYRERLEFVRMEIFDQIHSGGSQEFKVVQGKILNHEKFDQYSKNGSLRLNIGCGHKPDPEYINVDRRNLPWIDIIAEADSLPFEPGSLEEIYSAHLLEHFTPIKLRTLLSYWRDLLVPGGRLRSVVPDAEGMILAYSNGQMNFSDLRDVTFGTQNYDDDFHYTMFTADSLGSLLKQSGFVGVTIKDTNRINGKCREMEIVTVKGL
ncbi:hypothetical protein FACS1894200_03080 [Spirochaetia bacterium]|nr:hypothetical protein FACS1894200_03080 [Spirochaetia bacterium]